MTIRFYYKQMKLRKIVFKALNNALEGGWDERDRDPKSVALDLANYSEDVEDYCADDGTKIEREIMPLVVEWQKQCHEGV